MLCAVDRCPDPAVVLVAGMVDEPAGEPRGLVDELHAADPPLEVPLCRPHWVDAGRWSEGRIRAVRLAPPVVQRAG